MEKTKAIENLVKVRNGSYDLLCELSMTRVCFWKLEQDYEAGNFHDEADLCRKVQSALLETTETEKNVYNRL